jgi:molybdopterin/thiamine biosynthesis adenylyltransferase
MKAIIIGTGGVGSWLAPALCRILDPDRVTLIDGDKLEKKNLDRQLFNEEHIGQNKAEALARLYGCEGIPKWFSMGQFEINEGDWLMVCVDNHPARLAALQECDSNGCRAIFGANETYSAEACFYIRGWRGTGLDPRVYYPEILTDHSGDPRATAIGCTGEAQQTNRQLASANFMAAALMLQLFTVWTKAPTLRKEAQNHLPHKLVSNLAKMENFKVKDAVQPTNERTNHEQRD